MGLRDSARQGDGRKWEYSQEGDEVGGVIIGRSTFEGDYEPAEMLTIETAVTLSDGTQGYIVEGGAESTPETLKILMGSTVLRSKMEELDPGVGDEIAIFFKGKVMAKNAKADATPYGDFNVRVVRQTLRTQTATSDDGRKADWS